MSDHQAHHFGAGPFAQTCRCECPRCMSALSGCICIGCTCRAGDPNSTILAAVL